MWLCVFSLIQGVSFTTQDSARVLMFDFLHGLFPILTCSSTYTFYLEFIWRCSNFLHVFVDCVPTLYLYSTSMLNPSMPWLPCEFNLIVVLKHTLTPWPNGILLVDISTIHTLLFEFFIELAILIIIKKIINPLRDPSQAEEAKP